MRQYFVDELNRNYLPDERTRDQKGVVLLGLIDPAEDVVKAQVNLLSGEIVSIYDADSKVDLVVADSSAFGPTQQRSYAFDFDVALEDQRYDLHRIAPRHTQNGDRELALQAFVDGGAQLLVTLWADAHLTAAERQQPPASGASSPDPLAQAPLMLRTELLFDANDGFNFARQLYRQGGNSFSGIDAAFADPPESTAQILHPDKYINRLHPVAVELPDLATPLGPDWRVIGTSVLGELDTRVLLQRYGATADQANRIAAGWAGDRWQVLDSAAGSVVVLRSTWLSPDAASDFFSSCTGGALQQFPGAIVEESSDVHQALTAARAATDVRLDGRDVVIVIATDRATADTSMVTTLGGGQ